MRFGFHLTRPTSAQMSDERLDGRGPLEDDFDYVYLAMRGCADLGGTDASFLETVIIMATNVLFTLVATFTVDRWGRKPLLILGAIIMAVAMLAMGYMFQSHTEGTTLLAAAMLYVAGFALSWGPVVWVMLSELFPNSIKGKAMGIAVAAQWISNFIVTWSFLVIDGNSKLNAIFNHGAAYYFYGICSVLAALFVWKFVPETKGRTLEAIEGLWKKH